MFRNKNGKEHEFIEDKKRKYVLLWENISSKIQDKKQRTQLVDFFHKTLKLSKYAAI
jgi:hypothetical protein